MRRIRTLDFTVSFRKNTHPSDRPVVLECPKTILCVGNKEGRSNFTFPTTLPNDPCKLKMDPRKLSSLGWFVLGLLCYKSVAILIQTATVEFLNLLQSKLFAGLYIASSPYLASLSGCISMGYPAPHEKRGGGILQGAGNLKNPYFQTSRPIPLNRAWSIW